MRKTRDKRLGEELWLEWDGEGLSPRSLSSSVYYTLGEADMENEIVFRALACALQRDGVASSLGDGFKIANLSTTTIGWSGVVGGERYRMVCYQDGITESGDLVEDLQKTTWIDTFH